MNKYLLAFAKAVLAGILIGIAGTIYLTLKKQGQGFEVLGAFMFGFGLLVVCVHGLYLYTGKVGYIVDKNGFSVLTILVMILGNFVGLLIINGLLYLGNLESVIETAKTMVAVKLDHTWYEMLGLSILCGMMMYLAVEGYRRITNDTARVFVVIMAVAIFIIAKFEHSIADLFYFMVAGEISFKALFIFVILIIGNGIGAIMLNLLEKTAKLKD